MAVEIDGGRLSEIYQNATKGLMSVSDGLERLKYSSAVESPELSLSLKREICRLQSLCCDMDRLCRSVSANPQRDLWKRNIEQVEEEVDFLRQSLDDYFLMVEAYRESSHVDERSRPIYSISIYNSGARRELIAKAENNISRLSHKIETIQKLLIERGERPHRADNWITYSGMIITAAVVVLFFWR